MSSLLSLYKAKEKNGTETTVKKTFLVPLAELYVEPGYNVREIDQEHVAEFCDAFIAGEFVPPLAVQVTEQGIKIIDGHHRYYGAKMASEVGHEIPRLECKDFSGSEADRIAFMVTSSQGKALSPLERAAAYQRLLNQGWTPAEIAKKVTSAFSKSTLLKRLNSGDVDGACEELRRWIYAGGQKWRGLMNRRDMERTMCLAESADDLKG
ncbi:glycoside hydrolase family protein [Pantoea agglomerans]|uniref:glycoside hydrolase family protein n=1 Tax=Enterobacter agglomerans TaxID=549 RepID=UPI00320B12D5